MPNITSETHVWWCFSVFWVFFPQLGFKLLRQTQIAERERQQRCRYVRVASAPRFR